MSSCFKVVRLFVLSFAQRLIHSTALDVDAQIAKGVFQTPANKKTSTGVSTTPQPAELRQSVLQL